MTTVKAALGGVESSDLAAGEPMFLQTEPGAATLFLRLAVRVSAAWLVLKLLQVGELFLKNISSEVKNEINKEDESSGKGMTLKRHEC
jgi:hypothetical protein